MELKRTKSISQIAENAKRYAFETQKPISIAQVSKNPVRLLPDYTRTRVDYEESMHNPSMAYNELERRYYDMVTGSGRHCDATLVGLSELQKFRLNHANDCFSVHRQMDLKMDKVLPITNGNGYSNSASVECTSKCQSILPSKKQSTVMPYAMRQRLLRFQLEAHATAVHEKRRKVQQGV